MTREPTTSLQTMSLEERAGVPLHSVSSVEKSLEFLTRGPQRSSERSHGAAGSPLIGRDVSDQVGVREKPPRVRESQKSATIRGASAFIPRQFSPVFWSGLFTETQSIYLIGLESAEGYPLTVNDISQAREIPNDTPYTVM
ncbi:hypothetical protein TNCV_711631 [Trichonephila clavipes]|nr:hypothetical protein TNCV_711631 [Trichonephila clavipes]